MTQTLNKRFPLLSQLVYWNLFKLMSYCSTFDFCQMETTASFAMRAWTEIRRRRRDEPEAASVGSLDRSWCQEIRD